MRYYLKKAKEICKLNAFIFIVTLQRDSYCNIQRERMFRNSWRSRWFSLIKTFIQYNMQHEISERSYQRLNEFVSRQYVSYVDIKCVWSECYLFIYLSVLPARRVYNEQNQ